VVGQCRNFASEYCLNDVNCNFAHNDQITFGVAVKLIQHTERYYNVRHELSAFQMRQVAGKLRIEHRMENSYENSFNQENNTSKIQRGLENARDTDKSSKIINFLRKIGYACMRCSIPIFNSDLENRKNHVLVKHCAGGKLTEEGLLRLVVECFPQASTQLNFYKRAQVAQETSSQLVCC